MRASLAPRPQEVRSDDPSTLPLIDLLASKLHAAP
jgi:hypothetical protein